MGPSLSFVSFARSWRTSPPRLGRRPLELGLDGGEFGDAHEAVPGDRGAAAIEELAQLPPTVRPAMRQDARPLGAGSASQRLIGGVSVRLENACEAAQHRLGMLCAAAG